MSLKRIQISILVLLLVGTVFFVSKVFAGAFVLPQAINLAGFKFHIYGLVMALAVFFAVLYIRSSARFFGFKAEDVDSNALLVVTLGFLGARLYHVLSSIGYYLKYPLDVLKVWNGGLSIFGALAGGFLGLVLVSRKLRKTNSTFVYPILNLLDLVAPGVALGQAVGRWGNLVNYEAFGYPTNLPWKMFVPEVFRPMEFVRFEFFHPLFLYESLGTLCIFLLLYKISRRKAKSGQVFSVYLIGYGILRFCIEFLRTDSTFIFEGLRLNSVASLLLVVLGLTLRYWILSEKKAKLSS